MVSALQLSHWTPAESLQREPGAHGVLIWFTCSAFSWHGTPFMWNLCLRNVARTCNIYLLKLRKDMDFHPEKLHCNKNAPSDSHILRGLALESLKELRARVDSGNAVNSWTLIGKRSAFLDRISQVFRAQQSHATRTNQQSFNHYPYIIL